VCVFLNGVGGLVLGGLGARDDGCGIKKRDEGCEVVKGVKGGMKGVEIDEALLDAAQIVLEVEKKLRREPRAPPAHPRGVSCRAPVPEKHFGLHHHLFLNLRDTKSIKENRSLFHRQYESQRVRTLGMRNAGFGVRGGGVQSFFRFGDGAGRQGVMD